MRTTRITTVLLAAAMAVTAVGGPAVAAPPLFTERAAFTVDEIDPYLSDACGTTVHVTGSIRGKFTVYGDGSISDHFEQRIRFSTETGAVDLFSVNNIRDDGPSEPTIGPDGSMTFVNAYTHTGLPARLTSDDGVLALDAGRLQVEVEFTISADGEELLAFEDRSTYSGPHPLFEISEADYLDLFCSAVTG
jgi:hypothetical protein